MRTSNKLGCRGAVSTGIKTNLPQKINEEIQKNSLAVYEKLMKSFI